MKKVFIVGGSGKVARHLAQQLSARGHAPLSLHRYPEQAEELEALGSTPVSGDLIELNVTELAQLMAGSDVVVFSAGAGGKGGPERDLRELHGGEKAGGRASGRVRPGLGHLAAWPIA